MVKMNSALLANGGRFGPSENAFAANVVDGGQLGVGPILRNLDANTPPVFLPMTPVVMHVPTIFTYIPDGIKIFKALWETQLKNFDGFEPSYQMETEGVNVGRDGQQQMAPVRQTRSQITPSATWDEKIGNIIFNMGRFWFNMTRDVDTQASNMARLFKGQSVPPVVASMYSMDLLLIQHDSTMDPENIVDAYYLTNMFPTDIGSAGYTANPQESKILERQFSFTAVVQHNNNVVAAAKNVSRLLNLHTIDFQNALPIAETLSVELSSSGLAHHLATQIDQFRNLNNPVI